ncbi:MAG: hypothetical protein CM1200mP29_07230 [Verrucomicrobiota bacterium]|nr:MAG: hypothetical protein CM1200mP29_07230 [Verrucomicrobiota bacterium]
MHLFSVFCRLGLGTLSGGLGGVCSQRGPSEAKSPLFASAFGQALDQVDTATIDACMVCHSTREMQRGPVLDGFRSGTLLIS